MKIAINKRQLTCLNVRVIVKVGVDSEGFLEGQVYLALADTFRGITGPRGSLAIPDFQ